MALLHNDWWDSLIQGSTPRGLSRKSVQLGLNSAGLDASCTHHCSTFSAILPPNESTLDSLVTGEWNRDRSWSRRGNYSAPITSPRIGVFPVLALSLFRRYMQLYWTATVVPKGLLFHTSLI